MKTIFRNALSVLAVMVAFGAITTLAAQQVSSPTGAVLPRGLPILVQWSPVSYWHSPTVQLYLLHMVQGGAGDFVGNVANNGQTYLNLPASFPCNPAAIYQVYVYSSTSTGAFAGRSVDFRLSCDSGSLTVVKTVINESGRPFSNATFAVDVTCGSNGGTMPLVLTAANNFRASLMYLPHGASCFVNERTQNAPAGCNWTRTYPQGQYAEIGYNALQLVVQNRLRCPALPTGGPK